MTFAKRKFWIWEHGPVAKRVDSDDKPLPWAQPTLWKFTGDGVRPLPHTLPGIVTTGADSVLYWAA